MNQQTRLEIARIVEKYIPDHHHNERRKLGQDLYALSEHSFDNGYKAHRDYVWSKSLWWRLFYVF